jgi:hypothetical protein
MMKPTVVLLDELVEEVAEVEELPQAASARPAASAPAMPTTKGLWRRIVLSDIAVLI